MVALLFDEENFELIPFFYSLKTVLVRGHCFWVEIPPWFFVNVIKHFKSTLKWPQRLLSHMSELSIFSINCVNLLHFFISFQEYQLFSFRGADYNFCIKLCKEIPGNRLVKTWTRRAITSGMTGGDNSRGPQLREVHYCRGSAEIPKLIMVTFLN